MELEFDKEIDAILRKARTSRGVLVGDEPREKPKPKDHPDADVIAAFAENALPEKARSLYIEHFADCDRCRKQLSFAMQMNVASEDSVAPVVSTPANEVTPWYQSIFRAPNLALGMGALVLVFGGLLGFLMLQRSGDPNATISQIAEPEDKRGSAISGSKNSDAIPTPSEVPMSSANTAAVSANSAANTAMTRRDNEQGASVMSAPADDTAGGRSGKLQIDGASGSENNFVIDGQETAKAETAKKPAASAPSTADTLAAERDEKIATGEALKEENKDRAAMAKRKMDARGFIRDAPPPPPKLAGPMRAQQNQSNQSNVGQMSVTRVVGGKTFSNRDGAWYDSAYSSQATINIRRGTNEFKKLDSGLRNIADTLGGTVVVVWKAKAYRIQ